MSNISKAMLQATSGSGVSSGSYVAVAMYQYVYLFDHTTPGSLSLAASINYPGKNFQDVAFTPDDNYLAVAGGPVQLLDHTTRGTLTQAATYQYGSSPYYVEFSRDGNYLILMSDASPYLIVLDHTTPGSLSQASTYNTGARARACAFSPDGNYLAYSTSGTITLLDSSNLPNLTFVSDVTFLNEPYHLHFSPDGNYLVAAVGNTIKLFDHTTPGSLSEVASYSHGQSGSEWASFSSDGNYISALITGVTDALIILDHTTPGSLSLESSYTVAYDTSAAPFSPDGNYIAVGPATISLLDVSNKASPVLSDSYATSGDARGIAFTTT